MALKDYVTRVWGWDADWQKQDFRRAFSPAKGQIIIVDSQDAGFLEVIDEQSETLLSSVRLLPEFQGKGIGTQIVQKVIDEAKKKNQPVRLQVLKINPARRLYERLGFKVFDESETHFRMRFE